MSLRTYVGRRGSILEETPQQAHLMELSSAVLSDAEVEELRTSTDPRFRAVWLEALFPAGSGGDGLREAVTDLDTASVDSSGEQPVAHRERQCISRRRRRVLVEHDEHHGLALEAWMYKQLLAYIRDEVTVDPAIKVFLVRCLTTLVIVPAVGAATLIALGFVFELMGAQVHYRPMSGATRAAVTLALTRELLESVAID